MKEIAKDCQIAPTALIEDEVVVGAGSVIGDYTIIRAGTHIGKNVIIQDHCVVGKQPRSGKISGLKVGVIKDPLIIGEGVFIGCHVILYTGSVFEKDVYIADQVLVREKVHVGEATILGNQVNVKENVKIGARVKIQNRAHITDSMTIEDEVFIGPYLVSMSDKYMDRVHTANVSDGPTIKRFARVGGGVVLLPGVVIGEDAVVGAGAVVTKDVPARKVVVGVPAQVVKDVPPEQWKS